MTDPLEELLDAAQQGLDVLASVAMGGLEQATRDRLMEALAATDWAAYRLVKTEELEALVEWAGIVMDDEGLSASASKMGKHVLQPFRTEE